MDTFQKLRAMLLVTQKLRSAGLIPDSDVLAHHAQPEVAAVKFPGEMVQVVESGTEVPTVEQLRVSYNERDAAFSIVTLRTQCQLGLSGLLSTEEFDTSVEISIEPV